MCLRGMITCYITDRKLLPAGVELLEVIARNLQQGVSWVQIREKDLSARELFGLVEAALALPNPHSTKILVNTRADVAIAAGAAGVHLPANSHAPAALRVNAPAGFLIGVSCHTLPELRRAQTEGADYALFGPIFSPFSKTSDLAPRGIAGLVQATKAVHIPVLALGGITQGNIEPCKKAGAKGVAAISMFQGELSTAY